MPPTSIDGTDITGATIDGTDVQEITVDGDTVFSASPFLYKDGDEFTSKTGGWSAVLDDGSGEVTFNATNIFFSTPQSNGEKHHAGTNNAVTLNGDTLKIKHSSTNFPGFECGIGLTSNSGTTRTRDCATELDLTNEYAGGASFSNNVDTLDISGLSGTRFVRMGIDGASASSPGGQWTVHEVFIE